ncbi:hypothetical protein ACIFOC_02497 [Leucobacter aridicollis]|uniref:hypothetical protein n=1 Tax=Leucobacter aridicollis TaxID=283878 RepID=UPI0021684EB4|nr:hypothetical protein [Leucobacter aridicollis]MCS3428827.1 hypothetical protein [Leucobacter aridicollis]
MEQKHDGTSLAVEQFSTPEEDEAPTPPFAYWLTAAGGVIVAALCFTPLWGEVADAEASGRRSGISQLLASIGPVPIAGIAVLVAVVAVVLGVRAYTAARKSRTK